MITGSVPFGRITSRLILYGDFVDNSAIDKYLGELPAENISNELLPLSLYERGNKNINRFRSVWVYTASPKDCIIVQDSLEDLLGVFEARTAEISAVCAQNNLRAFILASVYSFGGELPEPELTVGYPSLLFASQIKAELEIVMENYPEFTEEE